MGPIRQIAESATHSKISACSGLKPKVSASLAFAQRGPARMARRTEVDRMFLILAALLFQLPIFAHPAIASASWAVENLSTAAESVAGHPESPKGPQIVDAGVESQAAEPKVLADGAEAEVAIAFLPGRVVPEPVTPAMTSPMALAASPAPATPTPIVYVYSSPGKIHPDRRTRRIWLGLSIAQHSGAAFDAWSTRRVLSERNAQESEPDAAAICRKCFLVRSCSGWSDDFRLSEPPHDDQHAWLGPAHLVDTTNDERGGFDSQRRA